MAHVFCEKVVRFRAVGLPSPEWDRHRHPWIRIESGMSRSEAPSPTPFPPCWVPGELSRSHGALNRHCSPTASYARTGRPLSARPRTSLRSLTPAGVGWVWPPWQLCPGRVGTVRTVKPFLDGDHPWSAGSSGGEGCERCPPRCPCGGPRRSPACGGGFRGPLRPPGHDRAGRRRDRRTSALAGRMGVRFRQWQRPPSRVAVLPTGPGPADGRAGTQPPAR